MLRLVVATQAQCLACLFCGVRGYCRHSVRFCGVQIAQRLLVAKQQIGFLLQADVRRICRRDVVCCPVLFVRFCNFACGKTVCRVQIFVLRRRFFVRHLCRRSAACVVAEFRSALRFVRNIFCCGKPVCCLALSVFGFDGRKLLLFCRCNKRCKRLHYRVIVWYFCATSVDFFIFADNYIAYLIVKKLKEWYNIPKKSIGKASRNGREKMFLR